MHVIAEVAQLRDRVDQLEEELRQMRDAFAPPVVFPAFLKLSATETRFLSALHARQILTANAGLGLSAQQCGELPTGRAYVSVMMHGLRKKLGAWGVEILNAWGHGYYLPPASKAIVGGWLA